MVEDENQTSKQNIAERYLVIRSILFEDEDYHENKLTINAQSSQG